MRKNRYELISKAGLFAALMISTAAGSLPVAAQRTPYPTNRRIEEINRQSVENERDSMNRELRGETRKSENSKLNQARKEQIIKDLEGIQAEYNKIVLNLQPNAEPSRAFIAETTENIKDYAARLKTNLALPQIKTDEPDDAAEESFDNARQSLRSLCKHIYNFITNPIFDPAAALNIEHSTRAQKELETIIEMSEKIKMNTGKQK